MKLWMKVLTVIVVTGAYLYLVFSFGIPLFPVTAGAFLCVLIMVCTFVILHEIKSLKSKDEEKESGSNDG